MSKKLNEQLRRLHSGKASNISVTELKNQRKGKVRALAKLKLEHEIVEFDATSYPLENLIYFERLSYGLKDPRQVVARAETGIKFRAMNDVASVSMLGAFDYERPLVDGGPAPKALSVSKLKAIHSLGRLKDQMPDQLHEMLTRVLLKEEFVWREKRPADDHPMIIKMCCALDYAGVHFGLINREDFISLWKDITPPEEPRRKQ